MRVQVPTQRRLPIHRDTRTSDLVAGSRAGVKADGRDWLAKPLLPSRVKLGVEQGRIGTGLYVPQYDCEPCCTYRCTSQKGG